MTDPGTKPPGSPYEGGGEGAGEGDAAAGGAPIPPWRRRSASPGGGPEGSGTAGGGFPGTGVPRVSGRSSAPRPEPDEPEEPDELGEPEGPEDLGEPGEKGESTSIPPPGEDDIERTMVVPREEDDELEHTLVQAGSDEGVEHTLVHAPAAEGDGEQGGDPGTGVGSGRTSLLDPGTGIEHTLISATSTSETTILPGAALTEDGFPKIPGVHITREIGRGGMGIVYEGKQGYLDRRVAVKLLATGSSGSQGAEFTKRFQREAKILAALNHPNVVSCYQAGVAPGGSCYLAMEFIDGPDLAQWIEEHGPLDPERAAAVCRAVASALAYAHRSGVIHRDVKPANVLLKPEPGAPEGADFPYQPMLADLGLARASRQQSATAVELTMQGLTVQGTVMGSPPTMAPEQFDAPDDVDYRADVYGLGCILFHSLTGKLAFPQNSLTSLIARKTRGDAPDPRDLRPDVPPELADLVAETLARTADERPSYDELIERLTGPFAPAPKPRVNKAVLGGVGAVLFLAIWAWVAMRVLGGDEPGGGEPGGGEPGAGANGELVAGAPRGGSPAGAPEVEPTATGGPAGEAGHAAGVASPSGTPGPTPGGELAGAGESGAASGAGGGSEPDPGPGGELGAAGASGPTGVSGTPGTTGASGATGAPSEPNETGATGAGSGEPDLPEPVWPELDPIDAGESWDLLSAGYGELPFEAWQRLAGERTAWSALEDSNNGAQALFVDGLSSSERALPAGPWTLTGELEILRPTFAATRRLAVVIGFAEGGGVALEQGVDRGDAEHGAHLGLRLVERSGDEGGTWVPRGEGAGALEDVTLSPADYKEAAPYGFRATWDGERLSIGYADGEPFDVALVPGEHGLAGPPVVLAVELQDGMAVLRDFVVTGD